MHVVAVVCLLALAVGGAARPAFYLAGVGVVAVLLIYEQSLVRADDLSQVKRAFDLNGYVGILYLLVARGGALWPLSARAAPIAIADHRRERRDLRDPHGGRAARARACTSRW